MPRTWLILDCNLLCHRAYHALSGLSHGPESSPVVYGFLSQVHALQEQFNTPHIAFCWDYGQGLREQLDPRYKAGRRAEAAKWDDDERIRRGLFFKQVAGLRAKYLRRIGYRNIFYQDGYEADDIIASLVKNSLGDDNAIIVSSDQDLYQLLDGNVRIWNPAANKTITLQSFYAKWGIPPEKWALVKAMAGCISDSVVGLEGVGEATAARYLRGELPTHYKAHAAIANTRAWWPNMRLVRLPWAGVNTFPFVDDAVTADNWAWVANRLGMPSLADRLPGADRGWGRRKGLVS